MSHTYTYTLTLAPPDRLSQGSVNTRCHSTGFEVLIDEKSGTDPDVLPHLADRIRNAAAALPAIRIPDVTPRVTCHLEEELGQPVEIELSPHLISVYMRHGAMPQRVADELAASIEHMLGHT